MNKAFWLPKVGTTSENNGYTGKNREITIDSETMTLRLHDGITQGGDPFSYLTTNTANTFVDSQTILKNQNADTFLEISNSNINGLASALVRVTNDGVNYGTFRMAGTGYNTVASWADSLIISTDAGISGGVKISSAAGGVKISTSGIEANDFVLDVSGNLSLGGSLVSSSNITTLNHLLIGTTELVNPTSSTFEGGTIYSSGLISLTRDNAVSGQFRRRSSNGNLIQYLRGNSVVGGVDVTTVGTAFNVTNNNTGIYSHLSNTLSLRANNIEGMRVISTGALSFLTVSTFSKPIRVIDTFDINGSTPSGQQDGLYVADLNITQGTTLNPTFTAAICAQINTARSVAFSVDQQGYVFAYRTHSSVGTYTWQSKTKFSDALTTARTITIGNTGKAFDGSANVSWSKTEIGIEHEWDVKTANFTAVAGDYYGLDTTTTAITVTLPATPTNNTRVRFLIVSDNVEINNITVDRNGSTIEGLSENLSVTDSYPRSFVLDYIENDWKVSI